MMNPLPIQRTLRFCILSGILAVCSAVTSLAQPDITMNPSWFTGRISITTQALEPGGFNESEYAREGNGITWDFSNAETLGSEQTSATEWFPATAFPEEAEDFPDATHVNVAENEVQGMTFQVLTFYRITSSEMWLLGNVQLQAGQMANKVIYTDQRHDLKFPMRFGQSHDDNYVADTYVPNLDEPFSSFSGNLEVTYDGFGTLRLLDQVFENTVRTRSLVITTNPGGITQTVRTYSWGTASMTESILTISVVSSNAQPTTVSVSYNVNVSTSTEKAALPSEAVRLYPNPTQGPVTLALDPISVGPEAEVRICNMMGQTVWQQTVPTTEQLQINLANQPAGVYFIRIESAHGAATTRLLRR